MFEKLHTRFFNVAMSQNVRSTVQQRKFVKKQSSVKLQTYEELVSFGVVSLYTNVPVLESINVCADLLFSKCVLPVFLPRLLNSPRLRHVM